MPGVTFEGVVATQALYESGVRNAKFRPVVFTEEDEKFIPVSCGASTVTALTTMTTTKPSFDGCIGPVAAMLDRKLEALVAVAVE